MLEEPIIWKQKKNSQCRLCSDRDKMVYNLLSKMQHADTKGIQDWAQPDEKDDPLGIVQEIKIRPW